MPCVTAVMNATGIKGLFHAFMYTSLTNTVCVYIFLNCHYYYRTFHVSLWARTLSNIPVPIQPQCSPEIREQTFPNFEKACVISPTHMPHWHSCIGSGKQHRIGPLVFPRHVTQSKSCLSVKQNLVLFWRTTVLQKIPTAICSANCRGKRLLQAGQSGAEKK